MKDWLNIEKIKKFNAKCRKSNYKTTGNWMVRYFERPAAVPFTWCAVKLGIAANQITLFAWGIAHICQLACVLWWSTNGRLICVTGLQLWYLLDHVDGQVARYKEQCSLRGRVLDFLMHMIVHMCFPIAVGLGLFRATEDFLWLVCGLLAGIAIMCINGFYSARAMAVVELFETSNNEKPEAENVTQTNRALGNKFKMIRKGISWIHWFCQMHVMMNIFTILVVIEVLFKFKFRNSIFGIWLIAVMVSAGITFCAKLVKLVLSPKS